MHWTFPLIGVFSGKYTFAKDLTNSSTRWTITDVPLMVWGHFSSLKKERHSCQSELEGQRIVCTLLQSQQVLKPNTMQSSPVSFPQRKGCVDTVYYVMTPHRRRTSTEHKNLGALRAVERLWLKQRRSGFSILSLPSSCPISPRSLCGRRLFISLQLSRHAN